MVTLVKSFSMAAALIDVVFALVCVVFCFISAGAWLVLFIVGAVYFILGLICAVAMYMRVRRDGSIGFWVCTLELVFGLPYGFVAAILALVVKDRRGDCEETLPLAKKDKDKKKDKPEDGEDEK